MKTIPPILVSALLPRPRHYFHNLLSAAGRNSDPVSVDTANMSINVQRSLAPGVTRLLSGVLGSIMVVMPSIWFSAPSRYGVRFVRTPYKLEDKFRLAGPLFYLSHSSACERSSRTLSAPRICCYPFECCLPAYQHVFQGKGDCGGNAPGG